MARIVGAFSDGIEVERPAEAVFAAASDLDAVFAALARRGDVRAERIVGRGAVAIGDRWRISASGRFGQREGVAEVTAVRPPEHLAARANGGGYGVETEMTITPLGPDRCLLTIESEIRASGLRAALSSPIIKLLDGRIQGALSGALRRAKERLEA